MKLIQSEGRGVFALCDECAKGYVPDQGDRIHRAEAEMYYICDDCQIDSDEEPGHVEDEDSEEDVDVVIGPAFSGE